MNWIKRHKFWVGIIIALAIGFAVEQLAGAEAVYFAIYSGVGVAIATWFLFNVKKIFSRHEDKTKEAQ